MVGCHRSTVTNDTNGHVVTQKHSDSTNLCGVTKARDITIENGRETRVETVTQRDGAATQTTTHWDGATETVSYPPTALTKPSYPATSMSVAGAPANRGRQDDTNYSENNCAPFVVDCCGIGFSVGNPTAIWVCGFGAWVGRPCGIMFCCVPCLC